MIEFINNNPDTFIPESVAVKDLSEDFLSFKESYIDSVFRTDPVILAEISPGKYNLIDGNHRVEKARRDGVESIMAYRIPSEHHIQFLTSLKAYEAYIEYWNNKLEDLRKTEKISSEVII